jgi:hypothetical protein
MIMKDLSLTDIPAWIGSIGGSVENLILQMDFSGETKAYNLALTTKLADRRKELIDLAQAMSSIIKETNNFINNNCKEQK